MAAHLLSACQWILLAGCIGASVYALAAALAMPFFSGRHKSSHHGRASSTEPSRAGAHGADLATLAVAPSQSHRLPLAQSGVSVLKPLCGAAPRLYENLRTFCEQRHAHFQLVLGVSSPHE
jgi:ceramide glucosyltransferase